MTQNVLILGANGRFGRNAAEAFEADGWAVTRFTRGSGSLEDAAAGMDVIVNAWNPIYTDWAKDVPQLTKQVIAAAKSSGATVIIPGNVYVFGESAPELFAADTSHGATNPLGRIRVDMEAAYRDAGVPTIILRCGDFLDTQPSNNWFEAMIIAKLNKGVFTYPGTPDIAHAWAFLPDAARAAVVLANKRGDLPTYAEVPFEGYTLSGNELFRAVSEAVDKPLRFKNMNWFIVRLAAVVWPLGRRLVEMSYLWRKPHRLDNSAFQAIAPDFEPTPLQAALRHAIRHQIDPDKAMA